MRRKLYVPILVTIVIFSVSCATVGIKTYNEMTPKEKALFLVTTYNKLDAEYRVQVVMPNLTEKDKELLRAKKQILTQVYPLIDAYRVAVEQNVTVPPSLEPIILGLLRQLGSKIGG